MQTNCPSCDAETFPGARFCRRCGGPLREDEGTGDVSPQAATVPLKGDDYEAGRATHGLGSGEERPSAKTTRVSVSEMERILRSQDTGQVSGAEPTATNLGRDTHASAGDGAKTEAVAGTEGSARTVEGAGSHDPEATILASSAVTRPGVSSSELDELTVNAPRPAQPVETRETKAPDSDLTQGAAQTQTPQPTQQPTSQTAPPPASQTIQSSRPGQTRRRWPVVVGLCAAVVIAVAASLVALRFLRRPSATEGSTQAPTAPAPTPDVRQQFEQKLSEAESLLAQGDTDNALARLREANEIDPSNTRAHRRLGELLLETGARRDAIEEFRAVTRNAPEDFTAWRQLATTQFAEGLYRDAVESYRHLIALVGEDSAEPSDLLSYADALRLSGRADEARAIYERLASNPNDGVAGTARQRLSELAQPSTATTQRPGEQPAQQPREGETATITQVPAQTQPTPSAPTPTPRPTPTPPPARPAEVSPAEHYQRGTSLWQSNRASALVEFRAAAAGGSIDAHYYLGLGYVEGRNLHSLQRAEVVAALQHFQIAERGQFAAESRRYAQQLEKEFDRLRKQ